MEKVVLWHEDIKDCFLRMSEEELDAFIELADFIQNGLSNYICNETLADENLWVWLYSKNDVGLVDMKREIRKKIEKAKAIDKSGYSAWMIGAGTHGKTKLLVLYKEPESASKFFYHIITMREYYNCIRKYLSEEQKNDFCRDLEECFPNICFSDDIDASINTLNRKYEEIRGEIVEHLSYLNDYKDKFAWLISQNKSNIELARAFKEDTGIDCSPQSGREHVQKLKEEHYNVLSGSMETITCELHTKFRKFNIDREKQDRIYFFPGKKGIENGNIIVKHIGTHL